uniref:Transcriptional regulator, MarR family n=1 Tax=Methanococcus maripaludis (strain C6 / ATCC BAA-1332) TaxID=444158 RepID=A9A6E8_METM6
MVVEILTKKHVREILTLLYENEEMYLSEIQKVLEIDGGNLSTLLNKLVSEQLIEKKRIPQGESIPKSYFKITELGKKAFLVYDYDEKLEKMKESKFKAEVHGKNNKVVQIDTFEGELNIK